MSKSKPKTAKFKIYKIKEEFSINGMLDDIKIVLKDKSIIYDEIDKNGYCGVIYSNESKPSWLNCIHELVNDNIKEKYPENISLSYVLFKKSSNNTIYGIAGGQGYLHVKGYCEKNYGLNLIPKLIENTDDVIKRVVENRLYDNQIYDHRVNKRTTSLNFEFDFTNLYKELGLILDKEILTELNLIDNTHFDDLEYIRFTNKDFISIEKSLSFKNLDYIFEWLDMMNQRLLNFELNSFISIYNDENYTPAGLIDLLVSKIINGDDDNYDIEIVGENIVKYLNSEKYLVKFDDVNMELNKDDCIVWDDIVGYLNNYQLFDEVNLTSFFKNGRLITQEDGIELESDIVNCLDCRIYDENYHKDYFLFDGNWFYLDYTFNEIITSKFSNIFDESTTVSSYLFENYPILKDKWGTITEKNENNYNNSFFNDEDIIVAHTLKPDNLEVADLIIYDNGKLYLICLKSDFDYGGCRDLFGQIEGSAYYVKNKLLSDDKKMDSYYESLLDKNGGKLPLTKDELKSAFHGGICYIAGFIREYRENPTVPMKLLTNSTSNSLKKSNFGFYLMEFNYE